MTSMSTFNNNPSSSASPVIVKITLNGDNEIRKFKLALKDLSATVLPDKLRGLLGITSSQTVTFERYSDSSASFIMLDANNPSVFKQLYRAAKAKGKLRIRATVKDVSASPFELPQEQLQSDRLSSRCYVHPYISEFPDAESGPSSRITTVADLKALAADPSTLTSSLAAKTHEEADKAEPRPIAPQQAKQYSWPVSENGDFSDATKLVFESKDIKTCGTIGNMAKQNRKDEAPVPHEFATSDDVHVKSVDFRSKCSPRYSSAKASTLLYNFTICCNHCDNAIADAHWHCGICDDGDYDLCESCINQGTLCDNGDHWMIKRFVKNGLVINSTTETIAPKKSCGSVDHKEIPGAFTSPGRSGVVQHIDSSRTCNSCIGVFDESNFVTCTVCEDYDLCVPCHVSVKHGHNPAHRLQPASKEVILDANATGLLSPGRNMRHWAICDGCDKDIYGTRFKCLNCPDWDYCVECNERAFRTHPGHRLVALHESISTPHVFAPEHKGIRCDGPLCAGKTGSILGIRYKCAVCHDTDFCANCEALPKLQHNRTHPLLKFKTPIRNVSVSTLGEKPSGEPMPVMGDKLPQTSSKSTETNPPASSNAATQVQTIAEVKPIDIPNTKAGSPKIASGETPKAIELGAQFVRDTVADGSRVAPATRFVQTWTLRNSGVGAWPAGCSVCFVGGDGMLDVDPEHPSHITQIRKAVRSNVVERAVGVGAEIEFSVAMRAPDREGKAISYWRLKSADGLPFGHKLWCDINVCNTLCSEPKRQAQQITVEHVEDVAAHQKAANDQIDVDKEQKPLCESSMIFPKLDKESPLSSTDEARVNHAAPITSLPTSEGELIEDIDHLELDDDTSDGGFLTDEDYELIGSGDEMAEAKNGRK